MSDRQPDSPTTRREFLAAGARTLALGSFAAFFVHQHLRARRLENDPNCVKLPTCTDCIELPTGCRLPQAEAHRAAHAPARSEPAAATRPTRPSSRPS